MTNWESAGIQWLLVTLENTGNTGLRVGLIDCSYTKMFHVLLHDQQGERLQLTVQVGSRF